MSSQGGSGSGESFSDARESGRRRRKLAGYLKAANELRQTYQQAYASHRDGKAQQDQHSPDDGTSAGVPDAAVVRSGDEELVLFPSYARRHVKQRPRAQPGTIQEVPGTGRDYRDSVGSGDAEFWKRQWEMYEDDTAIVDVDVRGWIYSPHKGPMTRKHKLFVALARQLVGVPAPATEKQSSSSSASSSRSPSPTKTSHRAEERVRRHDDEIVAKEAEAILRRGQREAEAAGRGAYSEEPATGSRENSLYNFSSRNSSAEKLSSTKFTEADPAPGVAKRTSWPQPSAMNAAELQMANSHLMARIRPFMANPLANTPISAFFYNDKISRQRTITTDDSGHFSIRAALDFVPTHVRILASESLSATEEIKVTEPSGVSLVSDIDDTIKHSAITAGAREIFRNAFIRDLEALTIEGVKQWYRRLADMNVQIHYVSNSPWQLYPVIASFFSLAGLPPGSFHLKQYSGMFQGIFEPVAERKKGTLEKIFRDFPERRFILAGDSGEADLEVYTDVVIENPDRVLGVFIRDVTTPVAKGFFDSSMGSLTGPRRLGPVTGSGGSSGKLGMNDSNKQREDVDLKAAVAASLRHQEEFERKNHADAPPSARIDNPRNRPSLPPRQATEPPATQVQRMEPAMGTLIDIGHDGQSEIGSPAENTSPLARSSSDSKTTMAAGSSNASQPQPPSIPRKPITLRGSASVVIDRSEQHAAKPAPPPPPKPRRLSSASRITHGSSGPPSLASSPSSAYGSPWAPRYGINGQPHIPEEQGYRATARNKIVSVYNRLPSPTTYLHSGDTDTTNSNQDSPSSSPSRTLHTTATQNQQSQPSANPIKNNNGKNNDRAPHPSPVAPYRPTPPPPPPTRPRPSTRPSTPATPTASSATRRPTSERSCGNGDGPKPSAS